MALIRAVVPLPVLAALAGPPSRMKKLCFRQWTVSALAGLLLFGCTLLLYSSYSFLSVGMATTLHFLYPLYVVLYEALFHHKRLGRLRKAGMILDLTGVALCSGIGNQISVDLRGFSLALASGLFYAAYILVLSRESRDPVPLYRLMLNVSLAGVLLCTVVGWITQSLTVRLTPQAWGYAVLAALLVSIIGCVLFQKGVRYIGDTDAAVYSLLEPISSILFGFMLMGDAPGPGALIGSMLILAGLLLNAVGGREEDRLSRL